MSIEQNGFLDGDIKTWIEKHRIDHRKLFDICLEANRVAQTHLYKLNIHSKDVQGILIGLLFIKALSSFQGSILLIERGMLAEGKILLRTLLEVLFRIGAISKSREIAQAYVLEDERHRKKFLNKFKLLSDSIKAAHGNPELDDLLNTLKQNIEEKDIKELQTQWFAKKAELSDYYNSAYSLFSLSVHANVRELEELVIADNEGNIKEILSGPDVTGIPPLLLTAGEALILITYDVSRYFKLSLEKELEALHGRLKQEIEAYDKNNH